MKILVIGSKDRYDKYDPDIEIKRNADIIFTERGTPDDAVLAAGKDAEVLFADAISPVSRYLIENMPALRMIHSEGVAFNVSYRVSITRKLCPAKLLKMGSSL